ncbi:MAG: alpha/beta hydrolase [Deltaproteobacteria bacterium]|nr:alpha/beta hydrolase [Deltaproteobacteria bacterium]MBW2050990.1 alpha/beta hydrolase [Deltaproteobacteria bacterium]MBW2141756.1 alpha/beta hydrolase [Deltaproteobacteria bacterium]MBW2323854.1 alpha/beta hydrolase [Deltaproteobacteria bacterium]
MFAQKWNKNVPALKSEYAEVNGIRLHYVSAGQGKPILFLHGFPEFWYCWKDQLVDFANDYTALALDMRGYNLSSKPADVEDYQIDFLVEDLRAFIAQLGYKKLILVGHDWGGAVAWAFASHYPEYLKKLIIINAPHPGIYERELTTNPDQQQVSQYLLVFRSPKAEKILSENSYARLFIAMLGNGSRFEMTREDRKMYARAWSQSGALTGGLNHYRASPYQPPALEGEGYPTEHRIINPEQFQVNVPTLVIWGEKDTILLPGNLEGLQEYVPDLTIERIPDGSHWIIHEQPERINFLIRSFI